MPDDIPLFEETLLPGAAWSHVLKRGTVLRLNSVLYSDMGRVLCSVTHDTLG